MKLEPKHLLPYLPYELSGICTEEFTGVELVLGISQYKNSKQYYLITSFDDLDIEMFKPILRPLSDLTKDIEVDCELTNISIDNTWGRFEEISTLKPHQLRFIQLREYELLLEYKFDVFGLIEQGLAIDINTL